MYMTLLRQHVRIQMTIMVRSHATTNAVNSGGGK